MRAPQHRPPTLAELSDAATSGSHAAALRVDSNVSIQRYLVGCQALERQADVALREGTERPDIKSKEGAAESGSNNVKPDEGRRIHANDVDIDTAFIALVKTCKLLIELLPSQHRGYAKLDAETKREMRVRGQRALDRLGKLKIRVVERFESWRVEHPDDELGVWNMTVTPASTVPTTSAAKLGEKVISSSSRAKTNSKRGELSTTAVEYVKPDRASTGFDVREILGHRTSPPRGGVSSPRQSQSERSQALPFPGQQQQYAFTSSPLQPFTHAHGKLPTMPPAPSSSGRSAHADHLSLNYPTLRPASSIRMNKHQTSQGFAPRSEQTLRYYQIDTSAQPGHAQHQQTAVRSSLSATAPNYPTPTLSTRRAQHDAGINSLAERMGAMARDGSSQSQLSPQSVEAEAYSLLAREAAMHHATTEGGEPLRSLVIPGALVSRFVTIAAPNTERNVETCGLLMGRVVTEQQGGAAGQESGLLVVTNLLIPKQSATSDRCDTEDEEGIWAFMDSKELVTLGWIHTHPRQSCFMSSLDLHTHASYQATLPEAVAIVCAPNDEPSFGLFRLTAPFGLQTILHCREPGLFHPHVTSSGETIQAIYTDAINGHVLMTDATLDVTDLR